MATQQTGLADEHRQWPQHLKAPLPIQRDLTAWPCQTPWRYASYICLVRPQWCNPSFTHRGSVHLGSTHSHEHNTVCANPGCFPEASDFLNIRCRT